jgi:uncharacterized membrane protein YgcG
MQPYRPAIRVRRRGRAAAGFTLAEVAVTVVIVGMALTLLVQGLNKAKIDAAQTRNLKLARELGLYKLGEVESGIYMEDIDSDSTLADTFAEQGQPEFRWEIALGDETFVEQDSNAPFDSWAAKREKEQEDKSSTEEEAEQPYERVKVRVEFRRIAEYKNEVVLERWLPWAQVHPTEAEPAAAAGKDGSSGAGSGSGATGGGSSSAGTKK